MKTIYKLRSKTFYVTKVLRSSMLSPRDGLSKSFSFGCTTSGGLP